MTLHSNRFLKALSLFDKPYLRVYEFLCSRRSGLKLR